MSGVKMKARDEQSIDKSDTKCRGDRNTLSHDVIHDYQKRIVDFLCASPKHALVVNVGLGRGVSNRRKKYV